MTETATAPADPTDDAPATGTDAREPATSSLAEPEPQAFAETAEEPDGPDDATPAPVEDEVTFASLGLSPAVVRAVEEMGYRRPTPIQEQAIPVVLMGRDVFGCAQTGTGKTAGFTLPMLDILSGSRARARMPRSLILEPTRELALQVAENFIHHGKYLKLTHALIIGGESMSDQRDVLARGVDVLIATPGRLIDMFERGAMLLTDTKLLVIDEADRMLDMGFIPDVERIVAMLPKTRQTLFFSATMAPEVRRLGEAFLQNPKEITVSRSASVATTITAGLALVAEQDKREALRRLVRGKSVQNALIFCNRKRDVDILFKSLQKHGFSVGALHGDMAQSVRFSTLEKFKANELQLLVCSDVAARGIDIGGLSHVFNFDVPHHPEDYVHRIGRTGRAGLEGQAYTLATPEDRLAVEAIEKLTGHPIPPMVVEGLDAVEWAEDSGRGRRGRGKSRSAAKPRGDTRPGAEPKAKPTPAEPKAASADAKPGAAEPKRRSRGRAKPVAEPDLLIPAPEPQPQPGESDVPVAMPDVAAPPRRDQRPEPRADMRATQARGTSPRQGAQRPPPHRGPQPDIAARPGAAPARDFRRRDDDPGPSVTGFGEEVPAFMLLRARPARPAFAGVDPVPEAMDSEDAA